MEVDTKSTKIKLYNHSDDDLPAHVKLMPAPMRRRWADNHNYHATTYQGAATQESEDYADQNTYMSAADMAQMMKNKKDDEVSEGTKAAKTPAVPASDDDADETDASADDNDADDKKPKPVKAAKKELSFADMLKSVVKGAKALVGGDNTEPVFKPFMSFKDAEGNRRVFMVWSNPFRDRAKEIISEAAHKEYEAWIDNNPQYHGEFHLWHGGPDSRWGKADFVAYVDGLSVVSGLADKGKEPVVDRLEAKANKGEIRVSHGFYGLKTRNDGVYHLIRPFEFSPLPTGKEANSWTGWLDISNTKELKLPFSDSRKKWLKEIGGLDDAAISTMESTFKAMGDTLKDAGVEWKGNDDAPTAKEPLQAVLGELNTMSEAIGQLAGLVKTSVETNAKALEGFQTELKKSRDDILADALTAKVGGAAPTGHVATQSTTNTAAASGDSEKVKEQKALEAQQAGDWFGNMLAGAVGNTLAGVTGE